MSEKKSSEKKSTTHTPKFNSGAKIKYVFQNNHKEGEVMFFVPAGKSVGDIAKKVKMTLPPDVSKDVSMGPSQFDRYLLKSLPETGSKKRTRYFTPTVGPVEKTGSLL